MCNNNEPTHEYFPNGPDREYMRALLKLPSQETHYVDDRPGLTHYQAGLDPDYPRSEAIDILGSAAPLPRFMSKPCK
jgi:hypothetical protein